VLVVVGQWPAEKGWNAAAGPGAEGTLAGEA